MTQYNRDISYMSLYFKSERHLLLLFLVMAVIQLTSMYQTLSSLSFQETGYQYSSDTVSTEDEELDLTTRQYDYVPTFQELIERCDYASSYNVLVLGTIAGILLVPLLMRKGSHSEYTLYRIGMTKKRAYYLSLLCAWISLFAAVTFELLVVIASY